LKAVEVVTLVIGIIGAASWLPWVYEYLQKPAVYGKLVAYANGPDFTTGWNDVDGNSHSAAGAGYVLGLSITCLRKDLPINRCSVYVRYPGDPMRYSGVPRRVDGVVVPIAGRTQHLRIPFEQDLTQSSVLEEGKTCKRYVSLVVPGVPSGTNLNRAEFDIVFRDYGKLRRSIVVGAAAADPTALAWDPALLSDTP